MFAVVDFYQFLCPRLSHAVEIKNDDKLKEGEEACFQVMVFCLII